MFGCKVSKNCSLPAYSIPIYILLSSSVVFCLLPLPLPLPFPEVPLRGSSKAGDLKALSPP